MLYKSTFTLPYLTSSEYLAVCNLYTMVSLSAGIVESLRNLLKDDDVTIREKSTECLYVMSCKS